MPVAAAFRRCSSLARVGGVDIATVNCYYSDAVSAPAELAPEVLSPLRWGYHSNKISCRSSYYQVVVVIDIEKATVVVVVVVVVIVIVAVVVAAVVVGVEVVLDYW